MSRFSGVVLDYYDDDGATLKATFPTADLLPEQVKEASIKPRETIPDRDFALIAIDGTDVLKKFACTDPGTTMMSVVYFMEHGDKLPEPAQKTAAANLAAACAKFDILPPELLSKTASEGWFDHGSGIAAVDITGQVPMDRVKTASRFMFEGQFPLDGYDQVERAERYLQSEGCRMHPAMRRECSVKLAERAAEIGYPLDAEIKKAGADTYANDGHLKAALEMRKTFVGEDPSAFLNELFEKRAEMDPEVYAECLRRHDIEAGIDRHWDSNLLDPWSSTFGEKVASVVWQDATDQVTDQGLHNLANNRLNLVKEKFTETFAEEFRKEPISIFNSMPAPQKKILARMAEDCRSDGTGEGEKLLS